MLSLIFKLFIMFSCLNKIIAKSDDNGKNTVGISLRLPRTLIPKVYKLEMKPILDPVNNNFTFHGKIHINFVCVEDTNIIVLNSNNLTIKENQVQLVLLNGNSNEEIVLSNHSYNVEKEFYIIHSKTRLKVGNSYDLYIEFSGILGTMLFGFYRGSYNDRISGEKIWFASTQFEPAYARKSFPCFDEPDLKAEFEVSITRRKNMTSISNMPLKETTDLEDGMVTDTYERSPPMSSYLVAYIVCDFEHIDSPDKKFRVWARKDALEQAKYALDIGPKIQKYFEDYFGLPFPLPKQDLVAVPDFYMGAMENFGMITFRESALLYDPNSTSDAGQLGIAIVISHELSHQWFGNFVTMKWFDGIWLNEGFASYVEFIGVDKVEPSWQIMNTFCNEMYPVFDFDAWNSSHPISANVQNANDLEELFDSISYGKGASVIRMMANFLSKKTMQAGLSSYLNKWKYNNTVQDDLWESLTEQAHKDKTLRKDFTVKEVMDSWTLKQGFPYLNVERSYDGNITIITFSQNHFTFNKEYQRQTYLWWIPVSFATPKINSDFSKTDPQFWLTESDKSIGFDIKIDMKDWLIVNVQQTGFYRVNYDTKNWLLIKSQLDNDLNSIPVINRGQIVNDIFNLARSSLVPYELAFKVTSFISNDDEYVSWDSYIDSINYLENMLSTNSVYGKFKAYIREKLKVQYDKFGFGGDDVITRPQQLHRVNIVSNACYFGVEKCVDFARNQFLMWMNSSNPDSENNIRKNFRGTVYCISLRYGGEKDWNFLWERFLNSKEVDSRRVLLSALSCTKEIWLINRYLKLSITPESEGGVAQQYVTSVLGNVAGKISGYNLALQFLDNNWKSLYERLGNSGIQNIASVLTSITRRLNTVSELKQFKSMIAGKDFGPAKLSVNQGLERIQTNIEWMEAHHSKISKWLGE